MGLLATAVILIAGQLGSTASASPAVPSLDHDSALNLLRPTGYALDHEGRLGAATGVYAGMAFDPTTAKVDVYLTDTSQFHRVAAAARASGGQVDEALVRVHAAAYTRDQLHASREKLMANPMQFGFAMNAWEVPSDGSGLTVAIADASGNPLSAAQMSAATATLKQAAGVPVTVKYGKQTHATSRTADFSPYYSGGLIYVRHNGDGSYHQCTTGLVAHDSNTSYVFTAAHCAHTGDQVYNGNYTYEGTVVGYNYASDSAAINIRGDQYEFDGGQTSYNIVPYRGAANAGNADDVYQDGYVSGIGKYWIVATDACWVGSSSYGSFTACGDVAQAYGSNSVKDGDSGGFVFSCNGSCTNPRIARGMVSGNYLGDAGLMAFTWVESILSYYGKTVY